MAKNKATEQVKVEQYNSDETLASLYSSPYAKLDEHLDESMALLKIVEEGYSKRYETHYVVLEFLTQEEEVILIRTSAKPIQRYVDRVKLMLQQKKIMLPLFVAVETLGKSYIVTQGEPFEVHSDYLERAKTTPSGQLTLGINDQANSEDIPF